MSVSILEDKSLVSGLVKFRSRITLQELLDLLEQLAPNPSYEELSARSIGQNQRRQEQFGIELKYRLDEGESAESCMDRLIHMFQLKFGRDLFAWDISAPTYVIVRDKS